MLKLKNISKVYELGKKKDKNYQVIGALKKLDLEFRDSEFVSILGPSGCGKTTLLNIIGGLDKYTSGDLIINKKSTKHFTDADWDNYRNHLVGFVFQTYNLIPHQTVLQNVELALTLSGVGKQERKQRAIEVLEKVGLKDKIHSKPNQLSGGQMQRVAIARALVNDPEIILADEPTGALDSKTSVQIMELLEEISKNKLIIMVTHNTELAKKHSTRIIKLLDGEKIDDTNPVTLEEEKQEQKPEEKVEIKTSKKKRTKMSFFTALSLSFKNLLTKKARTLLVAFAGSIGIIGIALILALSSGFSGYINKVQEDSLSSYPIEIKQQSLSMESIMLNMLPTANSDTKPDHEKDRVYFSNTITQMFNSVASLVKSNNMEKFNEHLVAHKSDLEEYISAIQYTYNLKFQVYNNKNTVIHPESSVLYDLILLYSITWFENEVNVTITWDESANTYSIERTSDENAEENDSKLSYFLGLYDESYFTNYKDNGNKLTGLTETNLVGIIDKCLFSMGASSGTSLGGGSSIGIGTSMSISMFKNNPINVFNEILDNKGLIESQYDLVAGTWMQNKNDVLLVLDQNNEIDDYILYSLGLLERSQLETIIENLIKNNNDNMGIDYITIINTPTDDFKIILPTDYYDSTNNELKSSLTEEEIDDLSIKLNICGIIRANEKTSNACLSPGIVYSKDLSEYLIEKYNTAPVQNKNLGFTEIDKSKPSTISIYVKDFASKTTIKNFINDYNNDSERLEADKINYDDTIDTLMNSINAIIKGITYILVAFVSISLIVSSIMIGIITYISVIERTKEIGVLRSVGASKRDVKRVFTAESLIIGTISGLFGIFFTLILCIPINLIVDSVAAISNVAVLPALSAVILILISMVLTFLAGLLPARIASKKDPVIALRTE